MPKKRPMIATVEKGKGFKASSLEKYLWQEEVQVIFGSVALPARGEDSRSSHPAVGE